MEKKERYIMLPISVATDQRIPCSARILYGIIQLLCRKEGACWASNAYLSEQIGFSLSTTRQSIYALEKYRYITTETIYKKGSKASNNRLNKMCRKSDIS